MAEILGRRDAAKVVVEAEGAILALHPSEIDLNRKWQICGGIRDDESEDLRETGVRELFEETGLVVPAHLLGEPIKNASWPAVDKGERVIIRAVFYHLILPRRPEIILSDEHDQYAWLHRDTHATYDANPELHELIDELLPV